MSQNWKRITMESVPLLIVTSFISTFAGSAIESAVAIFKAYPGLLLFVPAFLDACGDINSTFASKTACTMHMLGPSAISLRGKYNRILFDNIIATFSSALLFFVIFTFISYLFGSFIGLVFPTLEQMLTIIIVSGVIVSIILIAIAIISVKVVVKYNLDPDNFGSPIVATAADLLAANIYVFICFLILK